MGVGEIMFRRPVIIGLYLNTNPGFGHHKLRKRCRQPVGGVLCRRPIALVAASKALRQEVP